MHVISYFYFYLAQMLFAYRITSFEDLQTCGFQYTFNWLCHWVSIWDNRKRFRVHTFYLTAWLALLLAIGWSLLVRITSYTNFIKSSLSALRAQAEMKNSENLMILFSSVTMQPWEFYNNMCLDWVSEKVHKSNVIWSGGKLQTLNFTYPETWVYSIHTKWKSFISASWNSKLARKQMN